MKEEFFKCQRSLLDLVCQGYSEFPRHLVLSLMCFPNTFRSKFYYIKTENLGKCQKNALWIFTYDKLSHLYVALPSSLCPKLAFILSCLTKTAERQLPSASFKPEGCKMQRTVWYSGLQTCSLEALSPTEVIQGSKTLVCNISIW